MSLSAYIAKTWTDYADSPDLSAANVQYMDSGIAAVTAEVIALELALPTTYQPISAELSALAGLSSTGYAKRTGAAAWSVVTAIPQTDVSGLTAALAGLQPLDSDLTAIAALTTTTFGRSLLTVADAAAARTAIGAQAAGSYQASSSVLTSIASQSSGTGLLKLTAGVASLDSSVYALASSVPVASSTTPASLGTAAVGTGTTWARADHVHAMPTAAQIGAEPALGNPGTSGFLLSSTTAGVRSWVAPYSHPATHPQSVVDSASGWITTALAGKQASLGFTPVQQGGGTSQSTNKLYIGWSAGNALRLQVDSTDFGSTWPIAISGSSADSAKLGGQLPSYYALEGTIAYTGTGAVDPNTLTNLQSGFTQNTAANRPGDYAFVQTLGRYNGGSMQIASDSYGSDSNSLWWRRKGDNGTWYPWKTIWHTGNLTGDRTEHYHSADRAWANITGVPANVQNPQNYYLPLAGGMMGLGAQITLQRDVAPSAAPTNDSFLQAPLVITRQTSASSTNVAGIGFRNNGSGHAVCSLFYLDPVDGQFKQNTGMGVTNTFWHTGTLTPAAIGAAPSSHAHAWTSGLTGVPTGLSQVIQPEVHGNVKFGATTVGSWHGLEWSDPDRRRLLISGGASSDFGFYDNGGWRLKWTAAGALVTGTVPWGNLTGVPGTFTPASHTQAWSTITSVPFKFQDYPGASTYEGFWPSGVTPTNENFAILWKKDATETFLSAATQLTFQTTDSGGARQNRMIIQDGSITAYVPFNGTTATFGSAGVGSTTGQTSAWFGYSGLNNGTGTPNGYNQWSDGGLVMGFPSTKTAFFHCAGAPVLSMSGSAVTASVAITGTTATMGVAAMGSSAYDSNMAWFGRAGYNSSLFGKGFLTNGESAWVCAQPGSAVNLRIGDINVVYCQSGAVNINTKLWGQDASFGSTVDAITSVKGGAAKIGTGSGVYNPWAWMGMSGTNEGLYGFFTNGSSLALNGSNLGTIYVYSGGTQMIRVDSDGVNLPQVKSLKFSSIVTISTGTVLPVVAPGEVVMLVGASTGSVTNNPVTNASQNCKYRTSSGDQASAAAGGATVNLDLYGNVAFLVGRTTGSATLLS